jgi:hypothetical protein
MKGFLMVGRVQMVEKSKIEKFLNFFYSMISSFLRDPLVQALR